MKLVACLGLSLAVGLCACGDEGLPFVGNDAGLALDAGIAADSGIAGDAGLPGDAGFAADAGFAGDAGIGADAGNTADGGSASDGGVGQDGGAMDGGATVDGGSAADAGAPVDAGLIADAGTPPDGGVCDTRTVTEEARCTDEAFPAQASESWIHSFRTPTVTIQGSARHRCIDAIVNPDADQWVVGKFAYGIADADLHDEKVEVWVRKPVNGTCTWERLGAVNTTDNAPLFGDPVFDAAPLHTKGLGPDLLDDGGRAFFQVPVAKRLPAGAYPIRMLVKGDLSAAQCALHVWPRGTQAFVSDIDGTITTQENDGLWTLLDPASPTGRISTQEVHRAYVSKGYKLVYLTARPEMLANGTRDWFRMNNYPFAALHVSQSNFGEFGDAAVTYKGGYLQHLKDDQGVSWAWAYGNKESDLTAYLGVGVTASHIYLVAGEYTGDLRGSNRIESYTPEIQRVSCLPPLR